MKKKEVVPFDEAPEATLAATSRAVSASGPRPFPASAVAVTPPSLSAPDRTLSVPATLEPTPSSQCPSPIESIRLERARQMRLDADNDDQEPDTPLLSTAEDDEAEDETQFNSTSFWTYVDHILCAVHADAKAKANTTEEYEDILNKYVRFMGIHHCY